MWGVVVGDGVLGTAGVSPTEPHTTSGNYLDLKHPANCTGNLTMWHFCYYSANLTQERTYGIFFDVWRHNKHNSQNLERVHHFPFEINFTNHSNLDTLVCENVTDMFEVHPEDVLGVLILEATILGTLPLHVISAATSGFGLYFDSRGTFTVDKDVDLEWMPTLALHLYADVGKAVNITCILYLVITVTFLQIHWTQDHPLFH